MNRLLAPCETPSLYFLLDRASSVTVTIGNSFELLFKISVKGTFKVCIYLSDTLVLTNFKHENFFFQLIWCKE